MGDTSGFKGLEKGDLHILKYVHYMAQTARSCEAKKMFMYFLKQEEEWLKERNSAMGMAAAGDGEKQGR